MANIYKNASVDLTTTDQTALYTVPAETTAIVNSIRITNDQSSSSTIAVVLTDSSASATFAVTGTATVGANASTELLTRPFVLEESDILKGTAANADRLHVIISVLQITRT